MLNRSMGNLGDSFRQNRQDSEARKQRDIENSLRERQLKNQEQSQQRAEAGQTEAWLTGDDGGLVHYKGTPDGLQQVLDGAQQKGRTLRVTQPPKSKASIGSFTTSTPAGDFTFHLDSPEDVDKVMEQAKKMGGTKKGGEFKTAPIANAEHLASLQDAVTQATTPEAKAKAEQALESFNQLVKASKTDPTEYETVTEDDPGFEGKEAVPGVPPSHREIFGIKIPGTSNPGTPGTPAIPARPKQSVSYKRPRGAAMTPPPTMPNAAPAPAAESNVAGKAPQPVAANTEAIMAEANAAIKAGANPAAVKARLKEKYGITVK